MEESADPAALTLVLVSYSDISIFLSKYTFVPSKEMSYQSGPGPQLTRSGADDPSISMEESADPAVLTLVRMSFVTTNDF